MADHHSVEWIDGKREPQVAPNPAYPDGIDVDGAQGAVPFCKVELPYPAKRCGLYVVTCERCGMKYGCTTAGRPDDPRSITIACKVGQA
jgi:hypothetical protein